MKTNYTERILLTAVGLMMAMMVGCDNPSADVATDGNPPVSTAGGDSALPVEDEASSTDENSAPVADSIEPDERVRLAIESFHRGVCSEDETERIDAFDQIMPEESHFATLFGAEDGGRVWTMFQPRLTEMRDNTVKFKEELESGGELIEVEVIDTRKDTEKNDGRGGFADVIKAIPADIPLFQAVTKLSLIHI